MTQRPKSEFAFPVDCIERQATIVGRNRYALTRAWPMDASVQRHRTMVMVGLNPSVADAERDDPTIRRMMRFAFREGCSRLVMLNLFPRIAAWPSDFRLPTKEEKQVNLDYLRAMTAPPDWLVVCAWGNLGERWQEPAAEVIDAIAHERIYLCFGLTTRGFPLHPLYLAATTPLMYFPIHKRPLTRWENER